MKKILLMTAIALCSACSRSGIPQGQGSLSLSIEPDPSLSQITKSDVSEYGTVPAAKDFILTITNYSSQIAWIGKFTDFDQNTKFNVGTYTAKVESGNPEEEGKGKPCFSAAVEYSIVNLETTPVTLAPKLSNCIVKVQAGKYVKNYFSSWTFTLTTGSGNVFDATSGEAFFIDAYKFDLKGAFLTQDAKKVEFNKTFTSLQPAVCYNVVVDIDNVEGKTFTISFNDQVETIQIEEDLN